MAAEAAEEARAENERLAAKAVAAADAAEAARLAAEARSSAPTAPPAARKATVATTQATAQATAQAAEAQPPHEVRDPRAEEEGPRPRTAAQTEAMKHNWRRGLQGTLEARAKEREELSRRLLAMAPSEWSAPRSAEGGSTLVFRSLRPHPPQLQQLRMETAQAIASWVQGQGLRSPAERHPAEDRSG